MTTQVSPELYYTTLTAALTGLIWVPYIINRIVEMGPWPALKNPQPDTRPKAQWAYRSMNAHRNAIENLVVFASLAIIVHITRLSNELTATAAAVFFASRVAHLFIYVFGIPLARTMAFTIGFICQMVLALRIIGFW